MTCSDVDRILPDILEGSPVHGTRIDGDQDLEFQSHLRSCPACAELVADLKLIASEARTLANAEEPPPRVWVRIAAELRDEGLIREPEVPPARPVVVAPSRRRWNPFWLAPVAVAILAAGSYFLSHKSTAPIARQAVRQSVAPQAQGAVDESSTLPATPSVRPRQSTEEAEISAPVSTDDQQFLSEVSSRAPTMRATYENQLHAVNVEIEETQAYINRNPGDIDARQHLMDVYQQKAMLYQMALDRIQ